MKCRDFEECGNESDERYTMNFDDIGEPPIHWCAVCGPQMVALEKVIMQKMDEEPGFTEKFAAAIQEQEEKHKQELN